MKRITERFNQIKKSKIFQTIIGSSIFLTLAAMVMLFLETRAADSGINTFFQSLWFSIVTVTTVGYGDLSPVSAIGKIAAVVIMIIGVAYVAVVTGNITSWLVERNRRKALGLVPMKNIESQFLVCGWKPGMNELLKEILNLHNRNSSYLVLVNNADPHEVNDLRQDPLLRDIQYFSGDYSNTEVLLNACADKAEKALILADELSGRSTEEIDFQSVLASIALKRLKPEIYAIVEIVQPKFSRYLKNVDVEEILMNRFNARTVICNLAFMSGFNNVLNSFFSREYGLLKLRKISENVIGNSYQELKEKIDDAIVLGILENTGNLRFRKYEKMAQIQKSVTIEKAIRGLIDIKTMESNVPIFHPPPNYIVKENCSLITLNKPPGNLNRKHVDETVMEEKWRDRTLSDRIIIELKHYLKISKNWEDLNDSLKNIDLEIYQYQNKLAGVICEGKKRSFEELRIPEDIILGLHKKLQQRQSKKIIVTRLLNRCLEDAEDWHEFFGLLRDNSLEIYLYRQKASGVLYENRKYSFRTIGLDDDLIEEMNKHQDKFFSSSEAEVSKTDSTEMTYLSLADLKQAKTRRKQFDKGAAQKDSGLLLICGWKPQLTEMIDFIILQHPDHKTVWDKIVVVANIDKDKIEAFNAHFKQNPYVSLTVGDIVDQKALRQAGVLRAKKVIILAETESGKSFEEIDAQTVLTAMLIGSLNKHAYKIAEILDNRYEEALNQANVEEIFLEDEFIRIMLANGSHGSGVSKVLGELVNFDKTSFEILDIADEFIHQDFDDLRRDTYLPGKLILGLLEETGNIYARKSDKIHKAQIQSNIKGQVEELIKVKGLLHNNIIIAPNPEYHIKPNSKLILLHTNIAESWEDYLKFGS